MQFSEEDRNTHREELLSNSSGKFAPVVVTCHWDFADDLVQCKECLGGTFANCDLIEPFERVKTALATLHELRVLSQ